MRRYGATSEELGQVAVAFRKHAQLNPNAIMRDRPMTIDDYMESLRNMPGVDVEAALASGQLTVADAPGTTAQDGLEYWERNLWSAVDQHAPLIRAVGEMVSERKSFVSEQEMLGYEAALNLTIRRFPCVVICQYDVRKFSGQAVLAAMHAHPDMLGVPIGALLK